MKKSIDKEIKILNLIKIGMDPRVRDPRFQKYEEQFNEEGIPTGFTLEGNDFVFQYDADGGWFDEKGNYFDTDGVPQPTAPQPTAPSPEPSNHTDSEDNEPAQDDQIVDQIEQILIEEDEAAAQVQLQAEQIKQPKKEELTVEQLLQKYQAKEEIKEGLPQTLFIYFKMRGKEYERVTVKNIPTNANTKEKNGIIGEKKKQLEQARARLMERNKWLEGQYCLDFSGTSLREHTYDRYWHGYICCKPQNYLQLIGEIEKSQEFAPLTEKNHYALKSKFHLKKAMKDTVKAHLETLQTATDHSVFKIIINNLPEGFPLSLIYDFLDFSGGHAEDIEEAKIIDEVTAEIVCLKRTAVKFVNVEGYCHSKGEYIWLEYEGKGLRKIPEYQFMNVHLESMNHSYEQELLETLLLTFSRSELAKIHSEEEMKKMENPFSFALGMGQGVIKRVLMYRGNTISVDCLSVMVPK